MSIHWPGSPRCWSASSRAEQSAKSCTRCYHGTGKPASAAQHSVRLSCRIQRGAAATLTSRRNVPPPHRLYLFRRRVRRNWNAACETTMAESANGSGSRADFNDWGLGIGQISGRRTSSMRVRVCGADVCPYRQRGVVVCGLLRVDWKTWRRPTLPCLKTQYHGRWGFSRPSSGWDRVRAPRQSHQVVQSTLGCRGCIAVLVCV
jgi:hypothetical protein